MNIKAGTKVKIIGGDYVGYEGVVSGKFEAGILVDIEGYFYSGSFRHTPKFQKRTVWAQPKQIKKIKK